MIFFQCTYNHLLYDHLKFRPPQCLCFLYENLKITNLTYPLITEFVNDQSIKMDSNTTLILRLSSITCNQDRSVGRGSSRSINNHEQTNGKIYPTYDALCAIHILKFQRSVCTLYLH